MKHYGLTTKDNPYDLFKNYREWSDYDHQMGYNTSELLARIARTSDELSEEENQKELERAIDIIVSLHPSINDEDGNSQGIEYIKVSKEVK